MGDTRVPMWRVQPMQQHMQGPVDPPADPPAEQVEETSPDSVPDDKGFPAKTKVSDMEPAQQAAYYKFQARKHEAAFKSRADYDDLKAKVEQAERDKLSDHDKALIERYEAGKTEAQSEALTRAATAILKAGLQARGVDAKEIPDLLDAFNPAKFIKDGDVDTDRVSALAARMAGPVKDDGTKWNGSGQGARSTAKLSGREAGLAEAQSRFKLPTTN